MAVSAYIEVPVSFGTATHYESWVVPAGGPSALADIGGRV